MVTAAGNLGGIELDHVVARVPGFGARDHQQCVEGADQLIRFGDRGFQRATIIAVAFGAAQRLFAAVA